MDLRTGQSERPGRMRAGNIVVVIGGSEAEASGLTAVTAGDPTYAGPLAGVSWD